MIKKHFVLFFVLISFWVFSGSAWPLPDVESSPATWKFHAWNQDDGGVYWTLDVQLQPGWKMYWKHPGHGMPKPAFDFSTSSGLEKIEVFWPIPQWKTNFDMTTPAYEGRVVFPGQARIVTPTPSDPVFLSLTADILVCKDTCVPLVFKETIMPIDESDVGIDTKNQWQKAFQNIPKPMTDQDSQPWAEIEVLDAKGKGELRFLIHSEKEWPETVFVAGDSKTTFDPPQMNHQQKTIVIPYNNRGKLIGLGDQPIEIVVAGQQNHLFQITPPQPQPWIEKPKNRPHSWWDNQIVWMMLAGILGGLVLNIMPCVFPVLTLKLMSVLSMRQTQTSTGHSSHIRMGFLLSALGIGIGLMILASAMAALKTLGIALGWGIQFQQPWFLLMMVIMMIYMTGILMGWWEWRLFSKVRAQSAFTSSKINDLTSGLLVVLLATPCTAPFLSSAVGFAFSHGVFEIFMIMISVGLGLALPYLVVACFPGIVKILPRPGAWMNKIKTFLGAGFVLTWVWLLWVLWNQVEPWVWWGVLFGLVLMVGCWLMVQHKGAERLRLGPVIIFATLSMMVTITDRTSQPQTHETMSLDLEWQVFDAQILNQAIGGDRPVFIDVTAEWCITCQWNKRQVMDQAEFKSWAQKNNVILFRADWTQRNPEITAYLERFGRFGIPFNVIYVPHSFGGQGVVLPELLGMKDIRAAYDQGS